MSPVSPVLPSQFYMPETIIAIDQSETIIAKNQSEYLPLPSIIGKGGLVTTRWSLSWGERFMVLFSGSIYLQVSTFRRKLQPLKMFVDEPTPEECRFSTK